MGVSAHLTPHTWHTPGTHPRSYTSWKAHPSHVLDMALVGPSLASLSAEALTLHAHGGGTLLTTQPQEVRQWVAVGGSGWQ